MPSKVEEYMVALADERAVSADAAHLGGIVATAYTMLKRGNPLHWRIGPETPHHDRGKDQSLHVDDDIDGNLDPATWPSAQAFIDVQRRAKVARDAVKKAYAALSTLEKAAVQKPPTW